MTSHMSFGEELLRFARSVDIVTSDTEHRMRGLREKFLDFSSHVRHYVYTDWQAGPDGRKRLSLVASHGKMRDIPLSCEQGSCQNLLAFAYTTGKRLWVTGIGGTSEQYTNHWDPISDVLPEYVPFDSTAKCAIIAPIRWNGSVFGLLVLEASHGGSEESRLLQFNSDAAEELVNIADATAIIEVLKRVQDTQREGTALAINSLEGRIGGQRLSDSLAKPKVFVANSKRAERGVVNAILGTLKEEFPEVELVHWDGPQPGNLHAQLYESITTAAFGICYLSERIEGPLREYHDNPNVMFEAGMLHAQDAAGWIPIREGNLSDIFDIAAQNGIIVPRKADSALNGGLFRQELERRVRAMIARAPLARRQPVNHAGP